jgi:UDP-N-acetylglucosamine 1-carboxyvinyltransferase
LGATTKSKITITNVIPNHMDAVLSKLHEMGVVYEMSDNKLHINGPAGNLRAAKIETRIYPGIPTDLQAPFGVLATQAEGQSLIFDTLFDGRLQYIHELKKMGAEGAVLDSHRAVIQGPSLLHGTEMKSLDLRAGATLVIAALVAQGESIIADAEQIDRGYEKLDERLKALGADIKRVM